MFSSHMSSTPPPPTVPTEPSHHHLSFAAAVSNSKSHPSISNLSNPYSSPSPPVTPTNSSEIPVSLPHALASSLLNPWINSIVTKFFGPPSNPPLLQKLCKKLWKLDASTSITQIADNTFVVKCPSPQQKSFILGGAPWFTNGGFLAVLPWSPGLRGSDYTFNWHPVWIEIPDIPIELHHISYLEFIGNNIGKFLKADFPPSPSPSRNCKIHVLVQVDSVLPLNFRVGTFLQKIIYLNLPPWCAACKSIGHLTDVCANLNQCSPNPNSSILGCFPGTNSSGKVKEKGDPATKPNPPKTSSKETLLVPHTQAEPAQFPSVLPRVPPHLTVSLNQKSNHFIFLKHKNPNPLPLSQPNSFVLSLSINGSPLKLSIPIRILQNLSLQYPVLSNSSQGLGSLQPPPSPQIHRRHDNPTISTTKHDLRPTPSSPPNSHHSEPYQSTPNQLDLRRIQHKQGQLLLQGPNSNHHPPPIPNKELHLGSEKRRGAFSEPQNRRIRQAKQSLPTRSSPPNLRSRKFQSPNSIDSQMEHREGKLRQEQQNCDGRTNIPVRPIPGILPLHPNLQPSTRETADHHKQEQHKCPTPGMDPRRYPTVPTQSFNGEKERRGCLHNNPQHLELLVLQSKDEGVGRSKGSIGPGSRRRIHGSTHTP